MNSGSIGRTVFKRQELRIECYLVRIKTVEIWLKSIIKLLQTAKDFKK